MESSVQRPAGVSVDMYYQSLSIYKENTLNKQQKLKQSSRM